MYSPSNKPHRRSSASSHGAYVRPAHTRSTGSIPTVSNFSTSSKSPKARSVWFPGFGPSSPKGSSSYYKRRPRDGYVQRLIAKIRRILRDLYRYIRRNPVKVLLPLVMTLISSGALAAIAGRFGFRLPKTLMNAVGAGQSAKGGYDAWYGSQNPRGDDFGSGSLFKGAFKVASAFM